MSKISKMVALAVVASLTTAANAAPATQFLVLNQSTANLDLDKIPDCSKSVKTNCKKRGQNGKWYIVGAAGLATLIALAVSGNSNSVSP